MSPAGANADGQDGGDRVDGDLDVARDHQEDGDAHRGARGALRPREEDARRDHERTPQEGQVSQRDHTPFFAGFSTQWFYHT